MAVTDQPEQRRRPAPRVARVQEVRRLSPGMLRIVFGGEGLAGFRTVTHTDAYVKIHLPPAGAEYGVPFDPGEIRGRYPREQWPRTRTYTVRHWDPERLLLTCDFVVHGDEGVAGPWAQAARPGDEVMLGGPGGGYEPALSVGHHLFVGDEAVLPAIAASLERLTDTHTAQAIVQVPSPEHRLALESAAALEVVWLDGFEPEPVLQAVGAATFPPSGTQAFVHGEATMVRLVRRHLVVERGLALERLSASGYWKKDLDDERWREQKRDWIAAAEADLAEIQR